jgi:hypothetical protein
MRAAIGNWSTMGMGGYIYYSHDGVPASGFTKKYYNPASGAEPLNFRPGLLDAYNMYDRAGMPVTRLTDTSGDLLPRFEGQTIEMELGWDLYWLATPDPQQYYLLQARADSGYDTAPFQWGRRYARAGDKRVDGGLLIMHVDNAYQDSTGSGNPYPLSRPYVIKEAHGGVQDLLVRRIYDRSGDEDKYNCGDPGDLFGLRVKEFGADTFPSNRTYRSNVVDQARYDTNARLDAAYDPYRQTMTPGKTLYGEASNWYLSEITYHPDRGTVSFKVNSAPPALTLAERKLAKSSLSPASADVLADDIAEISEITIPDPAEAYKTNLTAIDLKEDESYSVDGMVDGTEYRAEVGRGNGLLIDLKLSLADSGDYKLVNLFEPDHAVDVTLSLPGYEPERSGNSVTVSTLVVDGRPENYVGVVYAVGDPNYGVKIADIGGRQVLVIYDGKLDGEANNQMFLTQESTPDPDPDPVPPFDFGTYPFDSSDPACNAAIEQEADAFRLVIDSTALGEGDIIRLWLSWADGGVRKQTFVDVAVHERADGKFATDSISYGDIGDAAHSAIIFGAAYIIEYEGAGVSGYAAPDTTFSARESGSGGGCAAGFGAFALIFSAGAIAVMRKR